MEVLNSLEEEEEEEDDDDDKEEEEEEEEEEDLDGALPTPKRRRLASVIGLGLSLTSGRYPKYRYCGVIGPYQHLDPAEHTPLDYLSLLWPDSLNDLIVTESNRYAGRKNRSRWVDITKSEFLAFLGVQLAMGIHRLPRINDAWSKDKLLGVEGIQRCISRTRFWDIRSNLHLVDDAALPPGGSSLTRKIKPLLDTLGDRFFLNHSPGQELAVDEAMIKYKGRAKGKVVMPKKPIKKGFKIWCCCCSCCGYLCTFQVYEGKPINLVTGKREAEKGMVMRVVTDLLRPFVDMNHVVYCDNFFSSGPLVESLAKDKIYYVGTIKQRALGFPANLKGVKPPRGSYVVERVGDVCYYVFNDRKVVSFVSNVFPEHMEDEVPRVQRGGRIGYQSVPPLLPAYNKYMGGVDRLSQLRKSYGYDKKSKRYWLRAFFQFLDYAVDNAFILYKHNCKYYRVKACKLLDFRLDLVRLLLKDKRYRERSPSSSSSSSSSGGAMDDVSVECSLVKSTDAGLPRGRCEQCLIKRAKPVRFTSYACSICRKRLCKIPCFRDFHRLQ